MDKVELSVNRDYKVVKANEIIQKARYDLNITELKAFAFILSKVKFNDVKGQKYTFTINEYCEVCGLEKNNGGNTAAVKKALKSLRDKSFWMTNEDGKEVTVGWLKKAEINKGSGKVTVSFDEDMENYIFGLLENYTQYSLLSTLPMRSGYSFRLYELLKSYAFTELHTFDIDDLKMRIGATTYTNFKDFRIKCLDIATKEINSYTDIEISWEPINKGRKVIKIKFYIKQRDKWGQVAAQYRATNKLDGQMSIFDYDPQKTFSEQDEPKILGTVKIKE